MKGASEADEGDAEMADEPRPEADEPPPLAQEYQDAQHDPPFEMAPTRKKTSQPTK